MKTLALCAGIALLLGGRPQARQECKAGPAPRYEPPAELRRLQSEARCAFTERVGELRRALEVQPNWMRRELTLWWELNRSGELAGLYDQAVALPFTPTEVCSGAKLGEFLVAGSTDEGETRIVRFEFTPPAMPLPGEACRREPAPLLGMHELFSAPPTAPTRDVWHLLPNRGARGRVFVQFWSTKDLYDLDLASGKLTEVATIAPRPGLLHVPELAEPNDFVYSREHRQHGYAYVFACYAGGGTLRVTPVLCDRDKDGRIDEQLLLDAQTWNTQGFGDPAQYVD